jgi:predicted TIM-barrel fold metal-dependent hydrolase
LLGNHHFDPIYEAAQEHELSIFFHVSGADFVYQGSPVPCGGIPETYSEWRLALPQIGQANLSSLVFSGALERYPHLNFVFAEFGFAWVAPLVWRMDVMWQAARMETPWVKRWPSDYVRERVRFTTQPIEEPRRKKDLDTLIGILGPEHLVFSTDYPHWDADNPYRVLQSVPDEWRRQICRDNALAFIPRLQSSP